MLLFTPFIYLLAALPFTLGRSPLDIRSPLQKRATANVCASINPTISVTLSVVPVSIPLGESLCLCLASGALTGDSRALLDATVQSRSSLGGTLGTALTVLGLGPLQNLFATAAVTLLGQQADPGCNYPTGAIPNQCGGCGYVCPNGGFVCGETCVAAGTNCVSGNPTRRRRRSFDYDAMCSENLKACAIPGSTVWTGKAFECVDIENDLESCGGCVNPIPGRPFGEDCTLLPNVNEVACVRGQCIINTCLRGYELNTYGNECVPSAKGRPLKGQSIFSQSEGLILGALGMRGAAV